MVDLLASLEEVQGQPKNTHTGIEILVCNIFRGSLQHTPMHHEIAHTQRYLDTIHQRKRVPKSPKEMIGMVESNNGTDAHNWGAECKRRCLRHRQLRTS